MQIGGSSAAVTGYDLSACSNQSDAEANHWDSPMVKVRGR